MSTILKKIYQGENGVIRWPLLQKNGQPLVIDDLIVLYVEFIQNGRVKKRYTYIEEYFTQDPEIRVCTDDEDGTLDISAGNVLEVEFTKELTESLSKQTTYLKVSLEGVSADLLVDGIQRDEFMREVFIVV